MSVGARARAALSRLARDERGISLPELLVGSAIAAMLMSAIASAIFVTVGVQRRIDDANTLAGALSVVSLRLDRDSAMALATAPARSQLSATSCATAIDLGFLEGGATVRYRTVASALDGPLWLERDGASGTRTIARGAQSCTWQTVQDAGGRQTLRIDLTLVARNGATLSQTLRAAPRLW